jgi:hypothetical protein
LPGVLPLRQSVICRLAKWIARGMSWLPMKVLMSAPWPVEGIVALIQPAKRVEAPAGGEERLAEPRLEGEVELPVEHGGGRRSCEGRGSS